MTDTVSAATWNRYQTMAKTEGFFEMAAAPVHRVKVADQVRDWVAQGNHADMHWYERGVDKRIDPRLIMEEARSVIMLSLGYESQPCSLAGKKLARYAAGDDYHDVLLKKLKRLRTYIEADFPDSQWRLYVDTGPILERYWAWQAGLGWIGKNGNLIHKQAGSYLFLATMLTNLTVPYGQPYEDWCGSCRACLDAFVAPSIVDSRRCISYLNIEHRGPFQDAPTFDDWIFGCDRCQEVCPWTHKFSRPLAEAAFGLRPHYEEITPQSLASMEQDTFSATFRKSPIKRTKMAGLKRNLAHLLGETPASEEVVTSDNDPSQPEHPG